MVPEMVQKTHLEPFREPLKVPLVGQPKNLFMGLSHSAPSMLLFNVGLNRVLKNKKSGKI